MCYDDFCPGPKAYEGLIIALEQIVENYSEDESDPRGLWAASIAKLALEECKVVEDARY